MLQAVAGCLFLCVSKFRRRCDGAAPSASTPMYRRCAQHCDEAWSVIVAGAQQLYCRTANNVHVSRRCRICAEGARFAEKVLQSEPTQVNQLEDDGSGSDSDDAKSESAAANGSPRLQHQYASATAAAAAVPTHATGEPPSECHIATEPPADHAAQDNTSAAALSTSDDPAAMFNPPQTVVSPAQTAVSGGADTAMASATEVHSKCDAGAPVSVQPPAKDRAESANCQAAPTAPEASQPEAADAADEKAARPLSEADEQFEVLCRALLAASQLIATVRPLLNTVLLSSDLTKQGQGWQRADCCLWTARLCSSSARW